MSHVRHAALAAACISAAAVATASGHPYGFLVYQDQATSQLRIDFMWEMAHHARDVRTDVPGLSADELSFEEITSDIHEPHAAPHRIPINAGAKIDVVFTAFSMGMSAYDPFDIAHPMMDPGASMAVGNGGTDFNRTIIWAIDPDMAGGGHGGGMGGGHGGMPGHVMGTASFYIRDGSGQHGDSPIYTFSLMAVPTPGALAAMGVAGVLAGRRRRR